MQMAWGQAICLVTTSGELCPRSDLHRDPFFYFQPLVYLSNPLQKQNHMHEDFILLIYMCIAIHMALKGRLFRSSLPYSSLRLRTVSPYLGPGVRKHR